MTGKRGFGRVLRGTVTSNKMDKSITVQVTRTVRHPRYGKIIKRADKYCAHDESNQCDIGDVVDIVEARPYSRTKRWRLQDVVEKVKK